MVTWASPPAGAGNEGWTSDKASYVHSSPPKIVKVEIEIMFDSAACKKREDTGDKFYQIINDGLFYHEMLHGWLAVHGKMRDEAWCKDFCACKKDFEFETTSEEHKEIYPWEFTYMKNLATAAHYNVVDKKVDSQAGGDGSFTIPTSIEKPLYHAYFFEEMLTNVDKNSLKLEWDYEAFHIVIKGNLIDKTKPGQVICFIDPPGIFGIITSDIHPVATPVGGIAFEPDKLALLAPYIILAALIAIATVSVAVYWRRYRK